MGEQQRHQEALLVSRMREELLQKEVGLNGGELCFILIKEVSFILVQPQVSIKVGAEESEPAEPTCISEGLQHQLQASGKAALTWQ